MFASLPRRLAILISVASLCVADERPTVADDPTKAVAGTEWSHFAGQRWAVLRILGRIRCTTLLQDPSS